MNILLIFLGAGLGGVSRYGLSHLCHRLLGNQFPYGTMMVNVIGCFFMGLLFVLIFERMQTMTHELRAFLLIGLLGGFTTFSAFSLETLTLFEKGAWANASINIFASMILCLFAVWLGASGGKYLCRMMTSEETIILTANDNP